MNNLTETDKEIKRRLFGTIEDAVGWRPTVKGVVPQTSTFCARNGVLQLKFGLSQEELDDIYSKILKELDWITRNLLTRVFYREPSRIIKENGKLLGKPVVDRDDSIVSQRIQQIDKLYLSAGMDVILRSFVLKADKSKTDANSNIVKIISELHKLCGSYYSLIEADDKSFLFLGCRKEIGYLPLACVYSDTSENYDRWHVRGTPELVLLIMDYITGHYSGGIEDDDEDLVEEKKSNTIAITHAHCDDDKDLTLKDLSVDFIRKNKVVSSMYPWLKHSKVSPNDIDKWLQTYIDQEESPILLLAGEPGTGKTTLISRLLELVDTSNNTGRKIKVLYCDDGELIEKNQGWFYGKLNDEDGYDYIILEDADCILDKTRREGNKKLSVLLNKTDGLIQNSKYKTKLIFTTNLSKLVDIDQALLRKGRCWSAVHFYRFTEEEAIKIAQDLNMEFKPLEQKFGGKTTYSLADIVYWKKQDESKTELESYNRFNNGENSFIA